MKETSRQTLIGVTMGVAIIAIQSNSPINVRVDSLVEPAICVGVTVAGGVDEETEDRSGEDAGNETSS